MGCKRIEDKAGSPRAPLDGPGRDRLQCGAVAQLGGTEAAIEAHRDLSGAGMATGESRLGAAVVELMGVYESDEWDALLADVCGLDDL